MHTFILDPVSAENNVTALRGDAASLRPVDIPPLPAAGPTARLSAALAQAIDLTNEQAALLSTEAVRVAGNMDVLTAAAVEADAALGARLEAIHP